MVNSSYHNTKDLIFGSIDKINELIEKCINTTFKTLADKYIEIKDNFHSIVYRNKNEEKEINIDDYRERIDNNIYTIKSKIENYIIDNKIKLDIIFEEGDFKKPKIVGILINKNRPKNLEIDIYLSYGQNCGKIGRKIIAEMNDISFSVYFNFDLTSNKAIFNTKTNFGEYIIKNYFYEAKEIKQTKTFGSLVFYIPSRCELIYTQIPEGENEYEIINAKKIETNITYDF